MLKIEIIKFRAQDVITSSIMEVPGQNGDIQDDTTTCICDNGIACRTNYRLGTHETRIGNQWVTCDAPEHSK